MIGVSMLYHYPQVIVIGRPTSLFHAHVHRSTHKNVHFPPRLVAVPLGATVIAQGVTQMRKLDSLTFWHPTHAEQRLRNVSPKCVKSSLRRIGECKYSWRWLYRARLCRLLDALMSEGLSKSEVDAYQIIDPTQRHAECRW
jgi:hypothetical protein